MLFRTALGVLSVLGVNSVLKDNKDPKTKDEIKNSIRKSANTLGKYASAIYEVATENINNQCEKYDDIHEKKEDDIEDYFKNIRKEGQE